MEHLRSLENPNTSDEQKAKIINEISESFDTFLSSEGNANILEVLNVFVNYLKNGDYQFFSESSTQKVRLEINRNFY
jgi:phenylpyruvate tautomerase PptA (4-oxalocrotonate tautomerase family)